MPAASAGGAGDGPVPIAGVQAQHGTFWSSERGAGVDQRQDEPVSIESLGRGVTLLVADPSGTADASNPIYLAGNINDWTPDDPAWRLTQRADQLWQISFDIPQHIDVVQFKFTLGGWDREEIDELGEVIPNRRLPRVPPDTSAGGGADDQRRPVVHFSVPGFESTGDGSVPDVDRVFGRLRPVVPTGGRVIRVQLQGGAGGAIGEQRDALLWEPRERLSPGAPLVVVLGPGVLDADDATAADWRADETVLRLMDEGRLQPCRVLALPTPAAQRVSEWLPRGSHPQRQTEGEVFADWIIRDVIPRVRRAASIAPQRIVIVGGGPAAHAAIVSLLRHPSEYDAALAFGPSPLPAPGPAGPGRTPAQRARGDLAPARLVVALAAADPRFADRAGLVERLRTRLAGGPVDVWLMTSAAKLDDHSAWADALPEALLRVLD
ncbi:MAG: CBM20 domain-containing protein [Planctomycetota bacterium]